jgi:hypothetical protein
MKIKNSAHRQLSFIFMILLCLLPLIADSQDIGSCAEKLKSAQSLFDRGKVEEVPSMLDQCMKSGFSREESLLAYRLLIQAYLFEEKLEKADSAMLAFLKTNPEYQISPTDHSSFVQLYNDFKVKSVVQLTIHLGTNIPFLSNITSLPTSSELAKTTYSTSALNFYGSLEARFELTKKMDLNFEVALSQLAFTKVEPFLGYNKNKYAEKQWRIELPVSVTYNLKSFGKLTPYARFGLGPAITLSATAIASEIHTDQNNPIPPLTSSTLDRKASRISMDAFAQFGAGLKFKTRGGYLSAEIRSNLGFLNQTIRVEDSVKEELISTYHIEDDEFHLNAANFSIGYTLIFYKPSKRKE